MKVILLLAIFFTALNASSSTNYSIFVVYPPDSSEVTSLNLRGIADNFHPLQLNLSNSILENGELNNFLVNTNKQSISSNVDFDYFITLIILKEYYLQISKYHQGFDLLSMKAGTADFIVKSYIELSKNPADVKWLNTSSILEYIASNEKLKNETSIIELVNSINALKN